jgi:peptide/nickel transport system substrate-binding protein
MKEKAHMLKRASVVVFVLVLCFAAGCNQQGQQGTGGLGPTGTANPPFQGDPPSEPYVFDGTPGTYGGTMVFSVATDPKSFNPITSSDTSARALIEGPVFTSLFGFDNISQKLTMGVATSYESSPDGLVWTIHLRPGVRWSDGQPFTADDVKFTFDVSFDPNVDNSAKSTFVQSDKSYPKVEVVDPLTVKFTLIEPNAIFLDNVGSTYLVARHSLEEAYKSGKIDSAYNVSTPPEQIVGLGPFVVKEYSSQQRCVLERNPYYWKVDSKGQRLPYLDRVIVQIVPDQNTILSTFQSGNADHMFQLRPEDVDLLKREEQAKDYKVYDLGPGFNYTWLVINQNTGKNEAGKPIVDPVKLAWFTNVKFRQAISYAVDREAILKTVYRGQGVPVYSFVMPANKAWYDESAVVKYPHDVEKAKSLLKEIGIEDRDGDGVAEDAKGNKIQFRLGTNSDNSSRVAVATIIKDNLKEIGIAVDRQDVPFVSQVQALQDTHDFDAQIGGWQSASPPDPILMKNILLSSGIIHYCFPTQKTPATPWEAQIDALLQKNQMTLDVAERKKLVNEAVRLWSENLPEIDLIAPNYFVVAKNRIGNLKPSPLPYYTYWNIDELYLLK